MRSLLRGTRAAILTGAALLGTAPALAQQVGLDGGAPGPLDLGKMWTFERPPMRYFTAEYGFAADSAWFARARLAALRIPGCSAAFVSPNGLVVTNHHCVRGRIAGLSGEGERLLDDGFRARTLAEERPIPDFYADQLIRTADVSDEILAALDTVPPNRRDAAREAASDAVETRLRAEHASLGAQLHVEVVSLYEGGRYSAYVLRRFRDVRLVAAAELGLANFGGDPDNFTYPRHALDFAVLRVYAEDGTPYRTADYFRWSRRGVQQGDAVFLIGNPGRTNRLSTVAQLEYQRDVDAPAYVANRRHRHAAMQAFLAAEPEGAEAFGARTRMLSLSNRLKQQAGRLDALRDPALLARKRAAEDQFRAAVAADPALARGGELLDRLAALQGPKRALAPMASATYRLSDTSVNSGFELRLRLVGSALASGQAAPVDSVTGSKPAWIERALLAVRLTEFANALGSDHPVVRVAMAGRPPQDAAAALIAGSVLGDSARLVAALAHGPLPTDDPGVVLARAFGVAHAAFARDSAAIAAEEDALAADLARVRLAVYGTTIAPDGSSSPRITDGRVLPYDYNGTLAPVYTTFFGMYGLNASHGQDSDWWLPDRWRPPPPGLDLGTPLNFVSTADSYGGNSGSPAFTPGLELVGLNFDRNIEGMSRAFIYLPERGRNVMVDVRAIDAALDHVYDLDRIVRELRTGRLFATERDADEER